MRIGEIIETTSTSFVAESFDLNRPPALGHLVAVQVPGGARGADNDVYAVVTYGQTVGIDPSRRAMRRGTDSVFDQEVYHEHPELSHILRTEFGAALVGFFDGRVRQHLPPLPPPLHFSVHEVSLADVCRFTSNLLYLRFLLMGTPQALVSPLQIVAANVREVYRQRGNDLPWLERAAREVAMLLKDDHTSLLTVLYAIDPGETNNDRPSLAAEPEVQL